MRYFSETTNHFKNALAGFLQLSSTEYRNQQFLLDLYKSYTLKKISLNDFLNYITKTDVITLLKISDGQHPIAKYVRHPMLISYWNTVWENVNVTHPITDVSLIMRPQNNIHPFDLLCGHFYYQQAMFVRQRLQIYHSYQELQFLEKAAQHQSINAAYELNCRNLKMIREGKNVEDNAAAAVFRSKLMIIPHKYLGYLLFAQAHLCYVNYIITSNSKDNSLIDSSLDAVEDALNEALKIYPHSQNEMNNALYDFEIYNELVEQYNDLTDFILERENQKVRVV